MPLDPINNCVCMPQFCKAIDARGNNDGVAEWREVHISLRDAATLFDENGVPPETFWRWARSDPVKVKNLLWEYCGAIVGGIGIAGGAVVCLSRSGLLRKLSDSRFGPGGTILSVLLMFYGGAYLGFRAGEALGDALGMIPKFRT